MDGRQQTAQVIDLVRLPRGARPIPFSELDWEEVLAARSLDCDSYNDCLAFVANLRWRGFSCRRCPFLTGNTPCNDEVAASGAGSVIHLP